ncbi:MAG: sterol desaturase family protein [Acidobacteriota bacterium]
MDSIKGWFFGLLLVAVAAELLWAWWRKKKVFDLRESLANLAIMLGNNLLKPVSLGWKYLVFHLLEPHQLIDLPATPLVFLATFLAADFAYYWFHRLSHEIPLLWTIHHTHHSSQAMNLTTAVRLNWLGNFISPLFFVPFVLLGFSPEWLVASLALGLFYQFFLHTEAIGRLGWIEGKLFNTPSAHRVHHGSNERYVDKNYGAVLVIWDRLFGTYEPETEPVVYGVTTGAVGYNPIKIVLHPVLEFLRGNWKREKAILAQRRSE